MMRMTGTRDAMARNGLGITGMSCQTLASRVRWPESRKREGEKQKVTQFVERQIAA